MRWNAFITTLLLITIALLITVLWFQFHGHPVLLPGAKDAEGIEYKDFISILLTALAVMIAVATILLAALALWGFGALKDEARGVAKSVAERTAKEIAEPVASRTAREVVRFSVGSGSASIQETPDEASFTGEVIEDQDDADADAGKDDAL
jgi:hypothetical protein